MADYVEDPFGRLVIVHWVDDEGPPEEPVDPDCKGGTWELMLDATPGGTSFVDIHDASTIDNGGLEGHRHFDLIDPLFDYSFLRVIGSTAEFGTPPPPQTPLSDFGFYCRGCKILKIEGSTQPGPAIEPPPTPPFPKYPAYVGELPTPALAYSQITSRWIMPPFPPGPFQLSWDYDYNLEGHAGGSPFDPSSGGGGVFYFQTEGGSSEMSSEYAAWYAYYFEGIGSDPGTVGDQFYTAGFHGYIIHIKLTFVC